MARSDGRYIRLRVLELQHRLRKRLNGRSGRFLHEQVALLAVLKRVQDKIHGILQRHHKARHCGVCDSQGLALIGLLAKQRDDRTARGHDIPVPGQAEDRVTRKHLPGAGDDVLFHDSLGHAHGIDRIRRLIRRQEDRLLHTVGNTGGNDIVRADHVGLDRLHGVKLTGGHLLERSGVKHIVHAAKCMDDGVIVAHIADVKLDLLRVLRIQLLIGMAHIILLFFVARENADLADVRGQKAVEHGIPERTRPAGYEQCFILKRYHLV